MHREADVFGPNGKERWLEEARMKALGVGVSRVDLDATDPGTPGALAERDPNADGDFIIPWYDPRFEAMYGHGANRNPSIDRALQRRLRAPTVHALRHGGKEAYTPAAMDARIAGVAARCRSTPGATGRALDDRDAALARREARRATREHRIARECDRRHAYALGDPALVAAALLDEYDELDDSNDPGGTERSSERPSLNAFESSDEKESVVSFVAARKPRADDTPASAKRTDAVWSATSPREKDPSRVVSPRDGLREFYGVNYFAALALEEACRRCAPPMRYQDPALTMNAEQARRYREEHPEQFTAMLPEGGPALLEEPSSASASSADLGRPRLGLKAVEGAARGERRPNASPSPRGSVRERRPGVPRVPRVPTPTPSGTSGRVSRSSGAVSRSSSGAMSKGKFAVEPRASSSRRGTPKTADPPTDPPADPPSPPPPPPPRLPYRAARLLELMWDPDGVPGGLPFSLANADKLARQNKPEGVERIRAWCRLIGVDAEGKPNGQHLCRLLRVEYRRALEALEAHAPGITEMARDAEEAEANEHNRGRGGTERRSANDGRAGWAATLCASGSKKTTAAAARVGTRSKG